MVPADCDICKRRLMIWDVTTFWCRSSIGIGEVYICDECLPQDRVRLDKDTEIDFRGIKTQEEKIEADTATKMRKAVSVAKLFDPGFTGPEDGSELRYNKRKAKHPWLKHTGWWIVHNCVSHVLIGILPLKSFFQFHDWTSRKMHGK